MSNTHYTILTIHTTKYVRVDKYNFVRIVKHKNYQVCTFLFYNIYTVCFNILSNTTSYVSELQLIRVDKPKFVVVCTNFSVSRGKRFIFDDNFTVQVILRKLYWQKDTQTGG